MFFSHFKVIAINGISLVGLPLSTCQHYIKVKRVLSFELFDTKKNFYFIRLIIIIVLKVRTMP